MMKVRLALAMGFLLFSAGSVQGRSAQKLTVEKVVQRPAPGFTIPRKIAFSPDGKWVTYLKGQKGSLVQDLWVHDLQTGESRVLLGPGSLAGGVREGALSQEEELRRERQRELGQGVTDYRWAAKAPRMVVPSNGDLYLFEGGQLIRLTSSEGPELDPHLSPDGTRVAYVLDRALYVLDLPGGEQKKGKPRRVSPISEGHLSYGLAEFIAQEELGRSRGFWWSPDGKRIAFTAVDESEVTEFPIVHQGKIAWGSPENEVHRYPFAGETNARVRLGWVRAGAGDVEWVDVPGLDDGYLAGVWWLPDGKSFLAEVLDRRQQRIQFWQIGAAGNSEPTLLLEESSPTWVEVRSDLHFVSTQEGEPEGFVLRSQAGDLPQALLFDMQGKQLRPITSESTYVDRILGVDLESRMLFFEAWLDDPRTRSIYKVSIDGGDPILLNPKGGTHHAIIDSARKRFVDVGSRLTAPPSVVVRDGEGHALATLHAPDKEEARSIGLKPPRSFEVTTEDGTTLFGHLYLPPDHGQTKKKRWPAILSVYGGPGVQLVRDSWSATVNLNAQYLARLGYVVLTLDNRGSGRRGRNFEGAIYKKMGTVEVADQVLGAEELVKEMGVDPARIGIIGWSYGGYLTAMAMAKAPDIFRVGVAGAPVTDWRGYDTCYTERYMGLPQENPEGYKDGSVVTHAAGITGDLMIIHGMIDENVHFRHTAILIEALIRHEKPHKLMVYPEARHAPRDPKERAFVQREVYRFFNRALGMDDTP